MIVQLPYYSSIFHLFAAYFTGSSMKPVFQKLLHGWKLRRLFKVHDIVQDHKSHPHFPRFIH